MGKTYLKHRKGKPRNFMKMTRRVLKISEDMNDLTMKMKDYVLNRGGDCESYIPDKRTKVRWWCSKTHMWWATAGNIMNGRWCPYCKSSTKERLCRKILESIFSKKFPISTPPWLINPQTQKSMHLDGFNEELKMAFEYNGKQHYIPVNFFGGEPAFISQIRRDEIKRKLCEEQSISLIEIPYTWDGSKQGIIEILSKGGIET